MKINFTLAKCKTRAAFSAKLRQGGKLNLEKLKAKYEIILETPLLLVLKAENLELIVHGHGEILFKNGENLAQMEKIAQEIYSIGLSK